METYFKNLTPEKGAAEQLLRELERLREDTEELFRASGNRLAYPSKEKFLGAVDRMRNTCQRMLAKASNGVEFASDSIREYPFSAVSLAFGLGLALGWALRRK